MFLEETKKNHQVNQNKEDTWLFHFYSAPIDTDYGAVLLDETKSEISKKEREEWAIAI